MTRILAALAIAVPALAATPAAAAEFQPYTVAALRAARAEGRPVLVHVHADWCPVCRAQAPQIRSLAARGDYDRLLVLTLDFDGQKAERKALGVSKQSTLIAFSGGEEAARSTGQTRPDAIRAMLDRAIGH